MGKLDRIIDSFFSAFYAFLGLAILALAAAAVYAAVVKFGPLVLAFMAVYGVVWFFFYLTRG